MYHSPNLRRDDASLRDAARFGIGVAAAGVAFLVLAAVWVSTCGGATADTLACGVPQRALLAVGGPAILLVGGVLAFARAVQTRRRGQASWAWHAAGWLLLTMMVATLMMGVSPLAGPALFGG